MKGTLSLHARAVETSGSNALLPARDGGNGDVSGELETNKDLSFLLLFDFVPLPHMSHL